MQNIGLILIKMIIGRISVENKIIYAILSIALVTVFWGLAALGYSLLYSLALFLPIILGIIITSVRPSFLISVLPSSAFLPSYCGRDKSSLLNYLLKNRGYSFCLRPCCQSYLFFNLSFQPRFHRENWRLAVSYLEENYPQSPVFILSQIDALSLL